MSFAKHNNHKIAENFLGKKKTTISLFALELRGCRFLFFKNSFLAGPLLQCLIYGYSEGSFSASFVQTESESAGKVLTIYFCFIFSTWNIKQSFRQQHNNSDNDTIIQTMKQKTYTNWHVIGAPNVRQFKEGREFLL